MNTKSFVRVLLIGMCLTITEAAFSQPRSRYTIAKYDELNRLICNKCGNGLAHNEYTKEQHKHSTKQGKLDCAIYEYPCNKCGTTWLLHILRMMNPLLNPPVNDVVEEKPSSQKKDRGNEIHKAIKDSCYSDIEELGMGLECHIIKLKKCMAPLYCYVEGENKVYLVEGNVEKSFCKEIGKDKKIHITHDKNSIPGMTIVK